VSARLRGEGGFTLIEMIAVCLLLGVVLTGVTTVMVGGSHAELQTNNRFKAQEVARTALDAMRIDVHNACAANVGSGGALLKLAYVPSGAPAMCGSSSTGPKILWCALPSPTLPSVFALYRSTASTCTAANGTLEADRLQTNVLWSTPAAIPVGQIQSVSVTLPVSYKQSVYGQAYTLGQTLVLRNTVYVTTGATTTCGTSPDDPTCTPGVCPPYGPACYPPVIQ
jgi:prepilin-type N-terminal cleavage/methylation domain-containing protein